VAALHVEVAAIVITHAHDGHPSRTLKGAGSINTDDARLGESPH
jgi:hypothetical protein